MRTKTAVLFWFLLVSVNLLLPTKIFSSLPSIPEEEITYIAEDEIGDFKVSIDGTRMLRVSWKEIELIHQAGEIWNPEEIKRGEQHLYSFPNDILVKVRRRRDNVEYRWGDSIPSLGFRQMNRVIITPKKVICDFSLGFIKSPPGSIIFSPVLFPGEEKRVKGKECLVKKSNGKTFKLIYPKELKSPFPWIKTTDTREIIFPLDEGKIRFSFSSLSSPTSLSFAGHKQFIIHNSQRGIVGSLCLSPQGSTYQETVHLEIAVEEEAEKEVEGIEKVDFGDDVFLNIKSDKTGHLFLTDEPVEFNILVDNFWSSEDRELTLYHKVRDYDNKLISHGQKPLSIKAKGKKSLPLAFSLKKKGIFSLSIDLKERGRHRGKKIVRFARLPHPATSIPPEESFFGALTHFWGPYWTRVESDMENLIGPWVEVMFRLGIRRPRLCNSAGFAWDWIEPKQGEFDFKRVDKLVNFFRENGLAPWILTVMAWRTPSWARGEETYSDNWGKKHQAPKDFSFVENFFYHLVNHFKDRVKYYEILNEPNLVIRQPKDIHIVRNFIQAGYKGAKRADPDCVVMGGSIAYVSAPTISYLNKILEGDGYKYMDVVTFHNYPADVLTGFGPHTQGISPEDDDYAGKIEKVETMAKKYYAQPRLWNTEASWCTTYHGAFPHSQFFSYEKKHANTLVRAYLLSFTTPVENFTWAHFNCYPFNRKAEHDVRARRFDFIDLADNIRPMAVAHANLASLFEGAKFKKRISFNLKEAYGLAFENREGLPLIALWSPDEDLLGKAKLPFEKLTFLDIMGNEKKINSTLKLTPEPLYIMGNKGIKTEDLISSLEKLSFSLKQPLEIVDIFWPSRNEIMVILRNKDSISITVDSLIIEYNQRALNKKGIIIPALSSQPVRFKLRERVKEKCLPITVMARIGKETVQEENLVPSLLGFWHFDERKGKIAKDSSGRGNDGTIYGARWVSKGKFGSCLSFNGKDDYVDCGNDPSLDLGTGDFSLEAWIKSSNVEEGKNIIAKVQNDDNRWYFRIWRGKFYFYTSSVYIEVKSLTPVETDRWYHVVLTCKRGGRCYIYVNGKDDTEGTPRMDSTDLTNRGNLWIGKYSDTAPSAFKGLIDEVRIYKRALSVEEIKEHYINRARKR